MNTDYEGLEALATHLDRTPKRGFDMGCWSVQIGGEFITRDHQKNNYACGMTACVGGHAALIFPERLHINERGGLNHTKKNLRGDTAFADAFGLDVEDAHALCDIGALHQEPRQAAAAIRTLITKLKGE